ncbi:putative enoyl-CoA hydratase protein [Rhizobium etli CFN 42]|uniref:Enoyl-CoA hydratase protein n=1 Tax=Rhizobium etli (strain ATCC 51251 / DSM 11541 / JCM 21823 / NBRC 15573 / CFN 42) TaxID=347834 RepID=Q2K5T5_RHIEC|nr:MaoC family dehydratase [Rhizobium etli]ABC91801.1 putative enoyl-CoA hydratase protein [Rhizobium etli CFN 42]AGS22833.1 MaoC-like hydratase protein [Rhizobium etli bv. mimosae str. Mim1]
MRMSELYAVGQKTEIGSYTFTEENIIRFATRHDPQRFHVDKEAAKDTLFGGLCASGWHTTAAWMRTFLNFWQRQRVALAKQGLTEPNLGPSPGFQKLQWLRPVFAGDVVTYSVALLSSRPLASRPGWHLNTILCEGVNQNGDPVMRFESSVLEFD